MLSVPSSASTVAPEHQAHNRGPEAPKPPSRRKLWFFVALSAMVGVVGTASLKRPAISRDVRSGSPGFRQSSAGIDQHWAKKSVTVYLDPSLKKLGPNGDDAVVQAFGSWVASDPRVPDLSFDTGSTTAQPSRDGKSTVSYAEISTPGHEKDVAITVTYSNDKTGEILEADMILNARYPMGVLKAKLAEAGGKQDGNGDNEAEDCNNRYDAQNVATHEAGHFFGLGEDMTERRATMFLSISQCETHKRALSTSDVGAVSALYSEAPASEQDGTGPRACSFAAPSPSGAWAAAPALLLGLTLARRRRR
jgi:hypothetical protein